MHLVLQDNLEKHDLESRATLALQASKELQVPLEHKDLQVCLVLVQSRVRREILVSQALPVVWVPKENLVFQDNPVAQDGLALMGRRVIQVLQVHLAFQVAREIQVAVVKLDFQEIKVSLAQKVLSDHQGKVALAER